jgi:hypothetical protein
MTKREIPTDLKSFAWELENVEKKMSTKDYTNSRRMGVNLLYNIARQMFSRTGILYEVRHKYGKYGSETVYLSEDGKHRIMFKPENRKKIFSFPKK